MQLSLSENIKIFNNAEFGEIRAALIDNEPWFVLKDVCVAFGETNYRRVAARLDDEEKGVSQINTPGGAQSMTVVNEAGLYSALFAMQPEKARGVNEEYISNRQEQLKKFKHWVTHEVLPSIRKNGMYMTDNLLETAIANPDFVIGLIQNMKAEKEKNVALQTQNKQLCEKNEEMQPKADYFDDLVAWNVSTNFRSTAKELRIPERLFIKMLISDGYIYRDKSKGILPKAGKGDGLFAVKEYCNQKNKHGGVQTRVTPKGRETFRLLYASIRRNG